MARKSAVQAAEDQIKDQAFSELQALIEESDKLLKSSASLVGEEAETLRGQIALKLQQALDSVSSVRDRTKPAVDATESYIGGHPWQTVAISAGFGLVVGLVARPSLSQARRKKANPVGSPFSCLQGSNRVGLSNLSSAQSFTSAHLAHSPQSVPLALRERVRVRGF